MMNSIATVSVSGRLEEKLRAIAEAGFEGVEIFENDLLTYTDSPRVIGAVLRDQGLTCTAFQPFPEFEGMPPHLRKRVFDRAERKFDVMHELGAGLLIVCSNVSPESLNDRNRSIDDLRELSERAAARGLRVGFEALAWGRHIFDHRDAWALVKAVDHVAMGLILDSFHSLARNVPIDSLRSIDAGKIFLVQIADAPLLAMDPLWWSRHFRCMPGQGELALVDYLAVVEEIGYEGVLSLEIVSDRFQGRSTPAAARDGMRSLTFLREQVERRLRPAAPQPIPARADCQGVEFIEFCATEGESRRLQSLLRSLGFALAGHHRSKAVTRWRQGDINLVVNCEPEGFARAFDTVHGASVCAIGLRVSDPTATLERARALQIDTFSQAVAPGEFEIPAIRGVGGTLIYFVSPMDAASIWETDFTGVPGIVPDAGMYQVDHITQTMQYEEMLSWLLYYVSLFDVTKTPQVEIVDPVGLVMSQAVQSGDGRLRVTLNSSAAPRTLASRFVQAYAGAGVQHIAFRTDDILATASRLSELGMETLSIPGNYYDDLAARFGLDDALLQRLAAFNILYDRDEGGEYFQLYTRAFVKRFFFEIVQRSGYAGYGANNSAIRLAAQSRYKANFIPRAGLSRNGEV